MVNNSPTKAAENLIDSVLKRKEKYLSENPKYRRFESLHHRHITGKYIGDLIYGSNDGIITTFAVVAGVSGASLAPSVVIILGFANLLADGFSMGASNFLSERSEADYAKAQREKEEWEIDNLRELEVEEVSEIFEKKGFGGRDLERAVEIVTANKKVWIDVMMKDELGIVDDSSDDPKKHGAATFAAFVVAGFIPLIPYVFNIPNAFVVSLVIGALTLFTVGALRSVVTAIGWFRGGVEMLVVGGVAAVVAYYVGAVLERMAI